MSRYWAAALLLAAIGCRQGNASAEPPGGSSADAQQGAIAAEPVCTSDSLRPATAAPAEGLWGYDEPTSGSRVAVLVGPVNPETGQARITRRVETLELRAGVRPIRHAIDTASVRLELVPPFTATNGRPPSNTPSRQGGRESAAVYSVAPLVLLASYEPCAASARAPRIRYLRRDANGDVLTDVMLSRESTEGGGPLR